MKKLKIASLIKGIAAKKTAAFIGMGIVVASVGTSVSINLYEKHQEKVKKNVEVASSYNINREKITDPLPEEIGIKPPNNISEEDIKKDELKKVQQRAEELKEEEKKKEQESSDEKSKQDSQQKTEPAPKLKPQSEMPKEQPKPTPQPEPAPQPEATKQQPKPVGMDWELTAKLRSLALDHAGTYTGLKRDEVRRMVEKVALGQMSEEELVNTVLKMTWEEEASKINKFYSGNSVISTFDVRCKKITVPGNMSPEDINLKYELYVGPLKDVACYRNADNTVTVTSFAGNFMVAKK